MKLVFLHGAPAVGKLTVAKALLRLIPGGCSTTTAGWTLR
jgi:tRNA uridine 5-carbamoylmethylation protein Kti12